MGPPSPADATDACVIDWRLVERHDRAGVLSNVQIASKCALTEGVVRKRAKRDGCVKSLSAKIAARADELVRAEAVRAAGTSGTVVPEQELIEPNAQAARSFVPSWLSRTLMFSAMSASPSSTARACQLLTGMRPLRFCPSFDSFQRAAYLRTVGFSSRRSIRWL